MICENCGRQFSDDKKTCPTCGALAVRHGSSDNKPEFGMKWYKFLINFLLIAGGILSLIFGYMYIQGSIYFLKGYPSEIIYNNFPNLKTLNIVYGISCFVGAALLFGTRSTLAKYQAIGPKLLYFSYGLGIVEEIIYELIEGSILGTSLLTLSSVIQVILTVFIIFANKIYFDKRANLFIY